jgi:DNA-binding NtrC family response regulator
MNPRSVIADSEESGVVGPKTNSNQAGSSSCEVVTSVEPSPAQVTLHRNESDESDKRLTIEHAASDPRRVAAWPLTLDEVIKQTLVRSLRETGGNRRRTASLLGISRSTLYRMLARYGIGHVGRIATSCKSRVDPSEPPVPTV